MPAPRSAARVAATAVLALAPLALTPIPGADAVARSWTTVDTLDGAKLQACKDPVSATTWKIHLRVDGRSATLRTRATVNAVIGGQVSDRTWNSAWVPKGTISDPGAVNAPRRPGSGISFSLSADQAGGGGTRAMGDLGHC